MRVERPLLLLLAALTAGCADPEAFVDTGYTNVPAIEKPVDPVLLKGSLEICFSDKTPWAEVEALAAERCASHGLKSAIEGTWRWQCRVSSPHLAQVSCYDPEMLWPDGSKVNPFDRRQVANWERQTGKKAKPHNFMTGQQAPAPVEAPPAVPPAPEAPAAPALGTV
ncbi:MAG TPA: hypothetical protein VK196_17170, partial [Magnetospirillum sp.]|nr:hypothetical protein [Magnetospirillum sp.]